MQPTKQSIKADFLLSQIQQVSCIKDSLESILLLTQKALHFNNPEQQYTACEQLHRKISTIHRQVGHCVYVTKFDSQLEIDSCRIEQQQFCHSYDSKIEELNMALIAAENCVQVGENIRRENDRKSMPYQANNQKAFRKKTERAGLETAMKIHWHFRRQFVRNVELLLRVKKLNPSSSCHRLRRLGLLRTQQVGFRKYRQMKGSSKSRRCHSEENRITKPIEVGRKQASALLFLQEGGKWMLKEALDSLISELRAKNKAKAAINAVLQQSLDLSNKCYVLNHLRAREDLNYEESIAKIELEALVFNRNIQQKMLGVESRRDAQNDDRQRSLRSKSSSEPRNKRHNFPKRSRLSV